MDDQPRLLARRSEHGYTHTSSLALPGEPEAVAADYQAQLSERARQEQQARLRGEWLRARERIDGALRDFRAYGHVPRNLISSVRAVERSVVALDRRIP